MTNIKSTSGVSVRSANVGMDGTALSREAAPALLIEERRALQARVDALHRTGALPMARAFDSTASVASWSNWSNG